MSYFSHLSPKQSTPEKSNHTPLVGYLKSFEIKQKTLQFLQEWEKAGVGPTLSYTRFTFLMATLFKNGGFSADKPTIVAMVSFLQQLEVNYTLQAILNEKEEQVRLYLHLKDGLEEGHPMLPLEYRGKFVLEGHSLRTLVDTGTDYPPLEPRARALQEKRDKEAQKKPRPLPRITKPRSVIPRRASVAPEGAWSKRGERP